MAGTRMNERRLHAFRSLFLWLTAICCASCGDGEDAATHKTTEAEACTAVGACEGEEGRQECEALFELIVPSEACLAAMETASCEDHAVEPPPYEDVCLPPCDGTESPRCNGDGTLTRCSELSEGGMAMTTIRCAAACEDSGLSFTGTCGTQHEGQTSESGEDRCWCEDA